MVAFPLSPALSVCDSLADIDDLDAFLAAQGSLSHFPTPPLKSAALIEVVELWDEEAEDGGFVDEYAVECEHCIRLSSRPCLTPAGAHVAELFATTANERQTPLPTEVASTANIIWRAQLPPEVLALAYNILARYLTSEASSEILTSIDLLTVSAMALAVSFTSDHPPKTSYWSHHICNSAWTARQLDQSTRRILFVLDWRLHDLGSPRALDQTMARFSVLSRLPESPVSVEITAQRPSSAPVKSDSQPLTIVIEDSTSRWVHGQLTPEATPPCSAVEQPRSHFFFLPLLLL